MVRHLTVAVGVLLIVKAAHAQWSGQTETPEGQVGEVIRSRTLDDVEYRKDGNILRGTVIEHIPSEALRMQIEGGSIFVIETGRIARIVKEPRVSTPLEKSMVSQTGDIPDKKSVLGRSVCRCYIQALDSCITATPNVGLLTSASEH